MQALAGLQDRLPSFPTPIAQSVVEQDLGVRVSDAFSSLTPEPIAAASLGQVLLHTLHSHLLPVTADRRACSKAGTTSCALCHDGSTR